MKKLKSFILKTSLFLNPLFLINFSFANDFRDNKGNSTLFFAIKTKDVESIENLIALGADVNERDDRGQTPLHYASGYGILNKVVKALLKAGAKVNATDKNGNTPLHITSLYGSDNLDVVDFLIENGADVNGNTPLHWAVAFQRIDKVKLLLESGADVNIQNNNGETVLDLAILYDKKDVIDFLQRKKSEGVRENILKKTLDKCRGIFKI